MNKQKLFSWLKLVLLVSLPIILLSLPANYFDSGGSSVCLSVRLFNTQCYACGLTRSMMHLIHFDFEVAYAYNMLSFVVAPFLAYGFFSSIFNEVQKIRSF